MEERDYQALLVRQDGPILTLTFNNPERKNPLSQELVNELLWALDDAETADDVHVIVLTGAGGAFSAGADLKGMTADRGKLAKKGEFDDLLLRFDTLKKPIVARIPGYVMGGAMGIVACCHFAIACESALLATPEIKRGLFPMMIMAVLQRVIHPRELLKLMLLGEKITATKAKEIGLLTEVVPDDELDERVAELAGQLAKQSPTAMRMGLHAFNEQRKMSVEEALPYLREQLYAVLNSEDAREGLAAFFEKREPRWTGR
ncbi:MAG: enoyl-CoA hydratase-related protein [Polyangiales bacterium]|jgi:enoyl-CoA hydratase/carnithine racemase